MKYDDLNEANLSKFRKLEKIHLKYNIAGAFGLIGNSLINPSSNYLNSVKSMHNNNIEIWNHGYLHNINEFSKNSFTEQVFSISKTQYLMKEKLGIVATTFGSPHNNSTEVTIRALKEAAPEIKNYLFAVDSGNITNSRQLLLRCNYEGKPGKIEIEEFYKNYDRMKMYPYLVLQGHPSYWNNSDFNKLEEIIEFLLNQGCIFTKANEVQSYEPEMHNATFTDLLDYLNSNKEFFLYGSGEIGREILKILTNNSLVPKAFLVSDNQDIYEDDICGIRVRKFSDSIAEYGNNINVVLSLLDKTHQVIRENIKDSGVDVWPKNTDIEYTRFVDFVRYALTGEKNV